VSGKTIYLFIWGYQDTYRKQIQILARNVLENLGAPAEAEVLLVGALSPDSNNINPICLEPEDGKWSLSLFDGLLDSVESNYQNHELQNMFYGDEPSMRDKPEWMRCDSVRVSVRNVLTDFDAEKNVISFCGEVRRINNYYVTPVIQIPKTTFVHFPPLSLQSIDKKPQGRGFPSLIHAAMNTILDEATTELQKPEPGRFTHSSLRDAKEIVRIAAKSFLHTPGLAIERQYTHTDLFDALNLVSSLMYEGTKGIGQLILVDPDNDKVKFLVRFANPVPFGEPRWVRKVLQMATTGIGIIADSQHIYGLGQLEDLASSSLQATFTVAFIDHFHWVLHYGKQALLRSHYGVPKLPQDPFDKMAFLANYARLFPLTTKNDGLNLWSLLLTQIQQKHGSMIVVAEDAANEALRLSNQGTNIKPTQLTESLLCSVSGIDGTIMLDPDGLCHAIGVILDGEVTEQCTPSRGSRYNSGVRYVQSKGPRRLAIVVSDDRTIDIIPPIRGLISKTKLEQHVATFEVAKVDNYHDSRNWLNDHRFYINADQCKRINKTLDRLDAHPKRVGLIYFRTERFVIHPDMEESYLTD
jgi:hypothetical protein